MDSNFVLQHNSPIKKAVNIDGNIINEFRNISSESEDHSVIISEESNGFVFFIE